MTAERYLLHPPTAGGSLSGWLVILWHGAGGDVDQRHLVRVAEAAAGQGAHVARARFGYRMAGKRAPERMPKLVPHARETIAEVKAELGLDAPRLCLGGRSMGGRVATMLAAEGDPVDALLLLSYPLHPAGKKEKLRDAHLYGLEAPMLFVTGDRDSLCDLDLLRPVLDRLGDRATLAEFDGADHSFRRVDPEHVADAAVQWLLRRA